MKYFVCILFSILFVGCASETQVAVPDTILPKEKMVEVMTDVHLLEASMNLNVYNIDKTVAENPTPGFDVLKKNNITKQQFDESFDFYSRHPSLLNEIYEIVLNDLSRMQAETMNKK